MIRLDVYLVEKGFFRSRQQAKEAIVNGLVQINQRTTLKSATPVEEDAVNEICISNPESVYVGRAGHKLAAALEAFNVDVQDKTCVDIGASTGGFTDCLLKHGARKIFAIDVGVNQMDPMLAADSRVDLFEKTNARYLTMNQINNGENDLAVIDVSFISLEKILLPVKQQLKQHGIIICLIKPQFEVGAARIGKKGIVKDPKFHQIAIEKIKNFAKSIDLATIGLIPSPILGGDGNAEFLICLKKSSKLSNNINSLKN